jgi:chemotaxis protein MotB
MSRSSTHRDRRGDSPLSEEEPAPGIPEWVVTFGDMMSLLLTFFIMLVSMSEIKHETQYQALVDSMRRQFGYNRTIESLAPGDAKPRASQFSVMSTTGRAKRKDTTKGGVPEKSPTGEETQVRIIRPGKMTAVGAIIYFSVASSELDDKAKQGLDVVAEQLRGKPQKIEVRGHTTAELAVRTAGTPRSMTLGYERAMATMRYLVDVKELPIERFRLSTAGDSEPLFSGTGADAREVPRVEVFLLNETPASIAEASTAPQGSAAANAAANRN